MDNMNTQQQKKKKKQHTLEEKYMILERLKNGESLSHISKDLKIHESTIRGMRRNEIKIRHWVSVGSSESLNQISRLKNIRINKMEKCLKMWVEDRCKNGLPINYPTIKHRALKMYAYLEKVESDDPNLPLTNLRKSEFNASQGWFRGFMNRFSLHNINIYRDSAFADHEATQKYSVESKKIDEEGSFTSDQISIADETAMDNNNIQQLKRKHLTLDEKYMILERLKNGESLNHISKELKINESTIRGMKRNESKIRHCVSVGSSESINRVCRVKNIRISKMEKWLKMWVEDRCKKGLPINYQTIKHRALKMYAYLEKIERDDPNLPLENLHKSEFNASNGWFRGFMNRFSLHNINICKGSAFADHEATQHSVELKKEGSSTFNQISNTDEMDNDIVDHEATQKYSVELKEINEVGGSTSVQISNAYETAMDNTNFQQKKRETTQHTFSFHNIDVNKDTALADYKATPKYSVEFKKINEDGGSISDQIFNFNETGIDNVNMQQIKRKHLTLDDKFMILERLKNGESLNHISKELKINESTIRGMKRNESKIRHCVSVGSPESINRVCRVKNIQVNEMEKCLKIWIDDCCKKNLPLNYQTIKSKALKIYSYLGKIKCNDPNLPVTNLHKSKFNASNGWFRGFINRFPLHNIDIYRDNTLPNLEAAQKYSSEFKKIVDEGGYIPEQIFNADETSLIWRKMLQSTNISKTKNRITVLLCSNASGDYMNKPMLVSHHLKPRALKDVSFDLSVHWRANNKALMTVDLFRDWFYNCFVPEVEEYTLEKKIAFHILLLADNCPSHPTDLYHPNVKIIFAPSNTSSFIQPLDQGIKKIFKSYYIRRTFEYIVNKYDKNPDMTRMLLWKGFSMASCIDFIRSSINELKSSTLNTCWKNIWPEVVIKEEDVTSLYHEINCIINIAHSLESGALKDVNESQIKELINNDSLELDEEELNFLTYDTNSNCMKDNQIKNENKESIQPAECFDLKSLQEIMYMTQKIKKYFIKNDPSPERLSEFLRLFKESLTPYNKILNELKIIEKNNKMKIVKELKIEAKHD